MSYLDDEIKTAYEIDLQLKAVEAKRNRVTKQKLIKKNVTAFMSRINTALEQSLLRELRSKGMKIVELNCNNIHIEFPWCDGTAYIYQNSGCLQLAWGECDKSPYDYSRWCEPKGFRQVFLAGLGIIKAEYEARKAEAEAEAQSNSELNISDRVNRLFKSTYGTR
jgi:hypothetical protein